MSINTEIPFEPDEVSELRDSVGNVDFKNRILFVDGYIDRYLYHTIHSCIVKWNADDDRKRKSRKKRVPIKIYITSDDGDPILILSIVNAMRRGNTPVYVINTGVCRGKSVIISMVGDRRFAYSFARYVFDDYMVQPGEIANMNISAIRDINADIDNIICRYVNPAVFQSMDTDRVLTARDAEHYHIIDGVISVGTPLSLIHFDE